MTPKKHATDAEVEARIEMVVNFITQGLSPRNIRNALVQREGISPKQANRYLEKAYQQISVFGNQPLPLEKGLLTKRLDHLMSRAVMEKNDQFMLEIAKSQMTLLQMQYRYPQKGETQHHERTSSSSQGEHDELEKVLRLFEDLI